MSTIDKEDWVYIEQHNEAVEYLEGRKAELEQALEYAQDDEAYILANLIELRWRYSDYKDVYEELGGLIKLHSRGAVDRALKLLGEKFKGSNRPEQWEL